jgi:UDP-galactopyranose mutase
MEHEYIVVGAGLAGSIFAHEANKKGKKVLVIDKRNHIGGNCYTEKVEGITMHKYGPHIFHTSNEKVWNYISQFTKFNNFINSPKAYYDGKLYSLPFNMNTFYELWGIKTPEEAKEKFAKMPVLDKLPSNLEEQALQLVGTDIYKILIKGYTEKQWGKPCTELPPEIIKRLPKRFTFNNNYFNDRYQGIPVDGYTSIFEKLLEGIEVKTSTYYNNHSNTKAFYTGPIDAYFDYCYGPLEYRSLKFETEILDTINYQGNAVINYTSKDVPYTRIIEHKHFDTRDDVIENPKTIVTKEFSITPNTGDDVYYPISTSSNLELLEKYQNKAKGIKNVIFAGRLGLYQYMNMDKVIENTLELCKKELGE